MKKTFLILSMMLFASTASNFGAVLSGGIYNPVTTHTYYLLTPGSWTSAETQAIGLGGHLVTINDSAENDWILSTFSNFGSQPRALWIGLNDVAIEGNYVWASGEASAFLNWEAGQPDDGGGFYPTEDHILIWPSPGPRSPGKWNDYIDSSTFPDMALLVSGVVEVPEPNCLTLLGGGLLALAALKRSKKR